MVGEPVVVPDQLRAVLRQAADAEYLHHGPAGTVMLDEAAIHKGEAVARGAFLHENGLAVLLRIEGVDLLPKGLAVLGIDGRDEQFVPAVAVQVEQGPAHRGQSFRPGIAAPAFHHAVFAILPVAVGIAVGKDIMHIVEHRDIGRRNSGRDCALGFGSRSRRFDLRAVATKRRAKAVAFQHHTEAYPLAPLGGLVAVAAHEGAGLNGVFIGSAAPHAHIADSRPGRIDARHTAIVVVLPPVLHPFAHVAAHVVEAPVVRLLLRHGVRLFVRAEPFVFAQALGEGSRAVACYPCGLTSGAVGVFPFRAGGQAVAARGVQLVEFLHESLCVIPRNAVHGQVVAKEGLAGVLAAHHGLPLALRDFRGRHAELGADGDVPPRFDTCPAVAAYDGLACRDEAESHAEAVGPLRHFHGRNGRREGKGQRKKSGKKKSAHRHLAGIGMV